VLRAEGLTQASTLKGKVTVKVVPLSRVLDLNLALVVWMIAERSLSLNQTLLVAQQMGL